MSEKNTLLVQIQGPTGVGKTTLAHFIAKSLKEAGFEILLAEDEEPKENLPEKIEALTPRTQVMVNTRTFGRSSPRLKFPE